MATVKTNEVSLAYAIESSRGTLPGTPVWYQLEFDNITDLGPTITTVQRDPVSADRQNRKGIVVNLESAVAYETDLTMQEIVNFGEAFLMATAANSGTIVRLRAGSDLDNLVADDALTVSGTPPGFSHNALSAAIAQNTILYARGFTGSAANGRFVVGANGSTTETPVTGSPSIVLETPTLASGAMLEVAGFTFTDLTWDDTAKQIGSAGVDLTTLGLTTGQLIQVGDSDNNEFTNGTLRGRVTAITAAAITLDKIRNVGTTSTLNGGGNESASSVDVLYGQYLRNVSTSDSAFVDRSIQFETKYVDAQNPTGTGDAYEYPEGNAANEMTVNVPLNDKATVSFGFIGTDTPVPTTTRKTNASNAVAAVMTEGLGTSSDIATLRLVNSSDTEITTCFKQATLTINNGRSPENCIGTLGAFDVNLGNFAVSLEGQVVFTHIEIPQAIRNNETLTFDTFMKNGDGGIGIDIPSLTLGGGDKEFPKNEPVKINLTGTAFKDATYDTSLSISMFPYLP